MAKMHVITDIKRIVVDANELDPQYWLDIDLSDSNIYPDFSGGAEMAAYSIKRQLLKGRRFNRLTETSSETWIIAHDDETAKLLGIEFECWNNLQKESNSNVFALNNLRQLSKMVDAELTRYKSMRLIDRLKFLFKGKT